MRNQTLSLFFFSAFLFLVVLLGVLFSVLWLFLTFFLALQMRQEGAHVYHELLKSLKTNLFHMFLFLGPVITLVILGICLDFFFHRFHFTFIDLFRGRSSPDKNCINREQVQREEKLENKMETRLELLVFRAEHADQVDGVSHFFLTLHKRSEHFLELV